jgi:hypothetical protein
MALLAGLSSLPIGILAFAAWYLVRSALDNPSMWTEFVGLNLTYALTNGALLLVPVTLIGLPLACPVMRPPSRPIPFALAGAVLTAIVEALELAASKAFGAPIDSIADAMLNVNHMGPRLAAGLVAGMAFAYLMRWWRPASSARAMVDR